MRLLVIDIVLAAATAAFATIPANARPDTARLLAATPTGPAQRCIRPSDISHSSQTIVNQSVILFGTGRDRGYRSDIVPACAALRPDRAIVTREYTSSLCAGDIFQVFDPLSRVTWGSCTFGMFTPYQLPRTK